MNSKTFKPRIVVGTPVTPKALFPSLAGSSFCVSFAHPRDLGRAIEAVGDDEILVLDNGAFTIWNAEKKAEETGDELKLPKRLQFENLGDYRTAFWAWANAAQERAPQAVAVIPDVITGNETENLLEVSWALEGNFADYPDRVMAIWHLDESLDQLRKLCRLMNFVGFGSCQKFDVTGTTEERLAYRARIAEASAVVDQVEHDHGRRPWIHLMRGLGVFPEFTRFESADSTNIAVNHTRLKAEHGDDRVRVMRARIQGQVDAGLDQAEIEEITSSISNFNDAPTRRPKL
jgi:hypothetical protein